MIGVNGQWVLQILMPTNQDFMLDTMTFKSLRMTEQATNEMPVYELAFITSDDKIMKYLHEGTVIVVSMGMDMDKMASFSFRAIAIRVQNSSATIKEVSIVGLMVPFSYTQKSNTRILTGTSASVIETVALPHFGQQIRKTQGLVTTDSMNWVQHGTSDQAFINNIALHAYIPNSSLVVGISAIGNFIMKDLMKETLLMPDWTFLEDDPKLEQDIMVTGGTTIAIKTASINAAFGYAQKYSQIDLKTGLEIPLLVTHKPVFSQAPSPMRTGTAGIKYRGKAFQSENVHLNYHSAYFANLARLTAFYKVTATVTFANLYADIEVLDTVEMHSAGSNEALDDATSGIWTTLQVERVIEKGQLVTSVVLGRESVESPIGDMV